jgi:hypothetical protein
LLQIEECFLEDGNGGGERAATECAASSMLWGFENGHPTLTGGATIFRRIRASFSIQILTTDH